jgi:hypothetical protein
VRIARIVDPYHPAWAGLSGRALTDMGKYQVDAALLRGTAA